MYFYSRRVQQYEYNTQNEKKQLEGYRVIVDLCDAL